MAKQGPYSHDELDQRGKSSFIVGVVFGALLTWVFAIASVPVGYGALLVVSGAIIGFVAYANGAGWVDFNSVPSEWFSK